MEMKKPENVDLFNPVFALSRPKWKICDKNVFVEAISYYESQQRCLFTPG